MKKSAFTLLLAWLAGSTLAAQSVNDAIEVTRGAYKGDRQTWVAENLSLTEVESQAFWPVYRAYRQEVERLGDELIKVVLEYTDVYPDVPDDKAKRFLKDYLSLEERLLKTRKTYAGKFDKVLPTAKVLRFIQLENRMDIVLRSQIADLVPLAPVFTGSLK